MDTMVLGENGTMLQTLERVNDAIRRKDWECLEQISGYDRNEKGPLSDIISQAHQKGRETILKMFPSAIVGEYIMGTYTPLAVIAPNVVLVFVGDYVEFSINDEFKRLYAYVVGEFVEREGALFLMPIHNRFTLHDAPQG